MNEPNEYQYFPSVTIGGPPGQYVLKTPLPSNGGIEFCIVTFSCLAAGPGSAIVSGVDQQSTVDTSGASKYSDNTFLRGIFVTAPTNTTIPGVEIWEKVANQIGTVFILTTGGTASFITIKFRIKVLHRIPEPFQTVPVDNPQLYHEERARRVELATLGREGELEVYNPGPPAEPGT